MATASRFGANPSRSMYSAKIRMLIASLLGVILILVVTIVFIIDQMGKKADPPVVRIDTVDKAPPVSNPASSTVQIVVAAQRLEEGVQITPSVLGVKNEDINKLPEGAIKEINKQLLVGKFTTRMIAANMPIVKEDIADMPPTTSINIPAGYRAVTITVDARTGVEGWARPNSRVDVLLTFKDPQDGKTKVATIVRFVKILSVAGATNSPGQKAAVGAPGQVTTVTILVTEADARKIELSRNVGNLSLSLVGDEETPSASTGPAVEDLDTVLGTQQTTEVKEPNVDGTMYIVDPDTGLQVKWILVNRKWIKDSSD